MKLDISTSQKSLEHLANSFLYISANNKGAEDFWKRNARHARALADSIGSGKKITPDGRKILVKSASNLKAVCEVLVDHTTSDRGKMTWHNHALNLNRISAFLMANPSNAAALSTFAN